MDMKWIIVETDSRGKIGNITVCTSLTLAREYSDSFAKNAPAHSVISIYAGQYIECRNGLLKGQPGRAGEMMDATNT